LRSRHPVGLTGRLHLQGERIFLGYAVGHFL